VETAKMRSVALRKGERETFIFGNLACLPKIEKVSGAKREKGRIKRMFAAASVKK
jgi:hypothetical protein